MRSIPYYHGKHFQKLSQFYKIGQLLFCGIYQIAVIDEMVEKKLNYPVKTQSINLEAEIKLR